MKPQTVKQAQARQVARGWLEEGDEYIYPARDCQASNACRSCPTFWCRACGKNRPWCVGGGDPHPDWCADCYSRRHRRLRGRPCGARACDERLDYRKPRPRRTRP